MKDYLYAIITGRRTGFIPFLLIGLLTPLSYIYAAGLKMRGWLYGCGLLKQKQLPCGVISVGNIVAGGTGKTPVVIWIAKYLQSEGFPGRSTPTRLQATRSAFDLGCIRWEKDFDAFDREWR